MLLYIGVSLTPACSTARYRTSLITSQVDDRTGLLFVTRSAKKDLMGVKIRNSDLHVRLLNIL